MVDVYNNTTPLKDLDSDAITALMLKWDEDGELMYRSSLSSTESGSWLTTTNPVFNPNTVLRAKPLPTKAELLEQRIAELTASS